MRNRSFPLLKKAADDAVERQKKRLADQLEAIERLERIIVGIDREMAAEQLAATGIHDIQLLAGYCSEQGTRRRRLADDLAVARDELERGLSKLRDLYLETKRYDHLVERQLELERAEATRRADAFLDWVAGRQHAAVSGL